MAALLCGCVGCVHGFGGNGLCKAVTQLKQFHIWNETNENYIVHTYVCRVALKWATTITSLDTVFDDTRLRMIP